MFTLKVTRSNGQIEQSDFATEAECLAHFEHYKALGYWGREEQVIHHNETIILHEEVPAVTENEIEIIPAVLAYEETIAAWDETIPAEYTYEVLSGTVVLADISPRQIRLALLSIGITEASVDTQIEALNSPIKERAMIAWKYSTSFQRTVPTVAAIGAMLGLSSGQLDELWILGAGL
jgi:hypothetical protein